MSQSNIDYLLQLTAVNAASALGAGLRPSDRQPPFGDHFSIASANKLSETGTIAQRQPPQQQASAGFKSTASNTPLRSPLPGATPTRNDSPKQDDDRVSDSEASTRTSNDPSDNRNDVERSTEHSADEVERPFGSDDSSKRGEEDSSTNENAVAATVSEVFTVDTTHETSSSAENNSESTTTDEPTVDDLAAENERTIKLPANDAARPPATKDRPVTRDQSAAAEDAASRNILAADSQSSDEGHEAPATATRSVEKRTEVRSALQPTDSSGVSSLIDAEIPTDAHNHVGDESAVGTIAKPTDDEPRRDRSTNATGPPTKVQINTKSVSIAPLANIATSQSGEAVAKSDVDNANGNSIKSVGPKAEAIASMLGRSSSGSGAVSRGGHTGDESEIPRIDPARFVGRVAKAFQTAHERGGTLQLRLSPPELGSLRLELTVKEGVMTAAVETETTAARRVLLDHLPALRERLAEQNIRVERFDVDVRRDGSGHADDRAAQHRQQNNDSHQGPPRRQSAVPANSASASSHDSPEVPSHIHDTGINVMA